MVKKPAPAPDHPVGPPQFVGMANVILGNVIKDGVATAIGKVANNKNVPGLAPAASGAVAGAVIDSLSRDKVFVNATNSEAWYQSGIMWGASTSLAGSIAVALPAILTNGYHIAQYDLNTFLPAFITLAGAVFTLIRRFVPGFKPLFSSATPPPPTTPPS